MWTRWKTLDLKSEDLDLILLLIKLLGLGFFLYKKDYIYVTGLLQKLSEIMHVVICYKIICY